MTPRPPRPRPFVRRRPAAVAALARASSAAISGAVLVARVLPAVVLAAAGGCGSPFGSSARGIEDPVPEQLRGTDLSVDLAPLIVPSRWPQPVAPATFGELAPSGEVPGVGSPAGGGPPPVRMLVRWRMPREPVREEEVDAPADVTGPRRHAGAVWSEVTPIRPGLSPAAGRGE